LSTPREQKAIAVLAIEHTLLKISTATLGKVETRLQEEYRCTLSDCYDHPEYLSSVLRDLFGPSHLEIVQDVNSYLEEFTYQKPIADFLEKIR
jgi:hypothetical protein